MWCSAVGFIVTLTLSLLAAPLTAQPRSTVPRIGILIPGTVSNPLWETFQQGLRDLGYVEGKNIVLEYRFVAGQYERLCRKFCSGGHEGAVAPVCVGITRLGRRTVRPQ